jgi:hypothetical protein
MAAAPDPAKLAKLIQSAPSGPSLAEQFTQAGTSPYAAYGGPLVSEYYKKDTAQQTPGEKKVGDVIGGLTFGTAAGFVRPVAQALGGAVEGVAKAGQSLAGAPATGVLPKDVNVAGYNVYKKDYGLKDVASDAATIALMTVPAGKAIGAAAKPVVGLVKKGVTASAEKGLKSAPAVEQAVSESTRKTLAGQGVSPTKTEMVTNPTAPTPTTLKLPKSVTKPIAAAALTSTLLTGAGKSVEAAKPLVTAVKTIGKSAESLGVKEAPYVAKTAESAAAAKQIAEAASRAGERASSTALDNVLRAAGTTGAAVERSTTNDVSMGSQFKASAPTTTQNVVSGTQTTSITPVTADSASDAGSRHILNQLAKQTSETVAPTRADVQKPTIKTDVTENQKLQQAQDAVTSRQEDVARAETIKPTFKEITGEPVQPSTPKEEPAPKENRVKDPNLIIGGASGAVSKEFANIPYTF